MRRRTLLKEMGQWLSGNFVSKALQNNGSNGDRVRRVARLRDLPVGKPVAVPVLGAREDAWTVHPDEVRGRVWLVRRPSNAKEGAEPSAQVAAFSANCPHLDCDVQHDPKGYRSLCPCHLAIFGLDGERGAATKRAQRNPLPRSMDLQGYLLATEEPT